METLANTQNLVKLKGQLERVTYENEENSYTVAKVRAYGYSDLVTIAGNIPSPTPGEILSMLGSWQNHPKFGNQFKVTFCTRSVPATSYGIEKYLGSGLIKGIGPVMAKRIVKKFGEKTLDVIEESLEKLLAVDGIGRHRVEMIGRAWKEQKNIRSVMIFLQTHGISSAYAAKIFKKYGNESINVVRENPYRLAYDIVGIGFLTADKIAIKLGFDEKSPLRAEACIIFTLHEFADGGHVYCPYENLIDKLKEKLKIDETIIEIAINSLLIENKIVIEDLQKEESTIRGVFLIGYYYSEVNIANKLKEIRDSPKNIQAIHADSALKQVQENLSISLADKQIAAVRASLTNKVLVITGSPGTGKTTITKSILQIFSKVTDKILLAAPTGRAAKRLSETTGKEAKTIHRLLEIDAAKGGFRRNEENPLLCDLLILDEVSMIDTLLMHCLMKAIPKHATLILVGDVHQLPSVGAGNVLKNIINSKKFHVTELNQIFRQAQQSSIIVNSHKIINGVYPMIDNADSTDFYFIQEEEQEKILSKIILMVTERIPQKFGYSPRDDIQVLTPMNRGTIGAINLNECLQNAINPDGFEITRGGRRYRINDKVMQIKNNYNKNVYNGDIGFVSTIDAENQIVFVNIDGNEISYDYSDLDELVLAYAVSIHKSQGSEYPVVVMPLTMSHYVMLQRNLIYTAVTRGKKLVIIVGDKKALRVSINNNKVAHRNTWLMERCIENAR